MIKRSKADISLPEKRLYIGKAKLYSYISYKNLQECNLCSFKLQVSDLEVTYLLIYF